MNFNRVTLVLSLLVVLLSGAVLGALSYRYYSLRTVTAGPPPPRTPQEFRQRYMKTMTERLHLTPDQASKLNAILDDTREQFRVFWDKVGPERRAIEEGQVQRINAILDPAQQQEYAKMRQEREERKRREGKGPGGPPPPPQSR